MAQITIYIEGHFLKKVESAARREHESISKWVQKRLARSLEKEWPTGYFELFGSLKGTDLKRPSQGKFADDARRAAL